MQVKLFYFKAKEGNVGDDLNAWLWPKLLSNILDDDQEHLLIGIGTLLNHKIPVAKKYTVLTSGIGYGSYPNLKHGEWCFVGLRGPLSQKILGIEGGVSLLDGAYLLPRYLPQKQNATCKIGYIPHVDSMIHGLWQEVADVAGIKLIDPRWPVEKFVEEICTCEQIVTEAMHGAILSDAYGIPWQPTKAHSHFNEFKWNDWAGSLGMSLHINTIQPTWKGDINESLKRKAINIIKRAVSSSGLQPNTWTPVLPSRSNKRAIYKAAECLANNAKKCEFYLSDTKLKETKVDFLIDSIDRKLLSV